MHKAAWKLSQTCLSSTLIDAQVLKVEHTTGVGLRSPTLYEQQYGFLYIPQESGVP